MAGGLEVSAWGGLALDDGVHGGGIGGVFQGLAQFFTVEEFGDIGEGMEVFLELALGDEEEHDEVDGLVVEGVEVSAVLGSAEGADDFVDEVGGGVGDSDSEPDAGAHRVLAFLDDGGDGVAVFGFNFAALDQLADQLVDGLPPVGGFQVGNNLVRAEDVAEVHRRFQMSAFRPKGWIISRHLGGSGR